MIHALHLVVFVGLLSLTACQKGAVQGMSGVGESSSALNVSSSPSPSASPSPTSSVPPIDMNNPINQGMDTLDAIESTSKELNWKQSLQLLVSLIYPSAHALPPSGTDPNTGVVGTTKKPFPTTDDETDPLTQPGTTTKTSTTTNTNTNTGTGTGTGTTVRMDFDQDPFPFGTTDVVNTADGDYPGATTSDSEIKSAGILFVKNEVIRNSVRAELGSAEFDSLLNQQKEYAEALKVDPKAVLPKDLQRSFRIPLICNGATVKAVLTFHSLLKSAHTIVICKDGKAYVGSAVLPAQNKGDVGVPFTDLQRQLKFKTSSGDVIVIGGSHKTHKSRINKISVIKFNENQTFTITPLGSGLKSQSGEASIPLFVTNRVATRAGLASSLVKKSILIANANSSRQITGFEIMNLTTGAVTDASSVQCSYLLSLLFGNGLTCTFGTRNLGE